MTCTMHDVTYLYASSSLYESMNWVKRAEPDAWWDGSAWPFFATPLPLAKLLPWAFRLRVCAWLVAAAEVKLIGMV